MSCSFTNNPYVTCTITSLPQIHRWIDPALLRVFEALGQVEL